MSLVVGTCIIAAAARPDDEAARDAAVQWLRIVDSGNYKDAALLMSEEVRGQQDWLSYLSAQRAPLGRVNKRQMAEVKHATTIPGLPDVRNYVAVRFKTSFERRPVAMEEVVMAKMGCCWEVAGYKISHG